MHTVLKSAIAAASMMVCGAAFAQTCATPSTWTPNAAGAPPQSGNTCGGTDSVSAFCSFLDSANKPDVVYQITLAAAGPSRTATALTIGGGGAGFTPNAYLYSDACVSADACAATGDAVLPLSLAGVAAGTYFLTISAASADASGACGPWTMTTNGTFPVSLQNFSVE